MANERDVIRVVLVGVLWVARGLGLLGAALVGSFAIGYTFGPEHSPPTFEVLLYPAGPPIAYLIGWRKPLWGGIVGLCCVAAFAIRRGKGLILDSGDVALFVLPGVLLVIYGVASWARARRGA
jgi:hypothetical protein